MFNKKLIIFFLYSSFDLTDNKKKITQNARARQTWKSIKQQTIKIWGKHFASNKEPNPV